MNQVIKQPRNEIIYIFQNYFYLRRGKNNRNQTYHSDTVFREK